MKVKVLKNPIELGERAAKYCADILKQIIDEKGGARLLLSTGASQFEVLSSLIKADVDWSKVEMFHLDEYVGLSKDHPASFRKYLKERFVDLINLKSVYYVSGEGDVEQNIREISNEVRREPIDLALIGIGENSHIAFNDPPADFDTKEAYIIVDLDERCKRQQVGEGWFRCVEDVPKQAITMTAYQIMQSDIIISCVPHAVKAEAVKLTLQNSLTNQIPATMLKSHKNWTLYIDEASASKVDKDLLDTYK